MPFSRPAKKIIKIDCVSLQVHKPKFYSSINKKTLYCGWKRVCLFTSRGSVTVEAALSVSLFIIVMLFLESFVILINTQLSIQIHMNNIVRSTAKKVFYLQAINKLSEYNGNTKLFKEKVGEKYAQAGEQDNESENYSGLTKKLLTSGYFLSELMSKIKLYENGNTSTMHFNVSKSTAKDGIIDMVLEYKVGVPLINTYIAICQRSRVKDWTGCDISISSDIVYITKSGTVYHSTKKCRHLTFNITKTNFNKLNDLRNNSGAKYKKCVNCVKNNLVSSSVIFVTKYGTRYHINLNCSELTRTVVSIHKSDVGERKPCRDCTEED